MKCHPGRWLWGLLPVAMLVWLALAVEQDNIQADLRSRVTEKFSASGLRWASPGFDGRDAIVSGQALTTTERRRASEIADGVWGVRVVQNVATLQSVPQRYTWTAAREPASIVLSGFVPTEAARSGIVAATRSKFPAFIVEDQMTVARGGPNEQAWLRSADFAVSRLGRLSSGARVDLEGADLMIAGRAGSSREYKLVRSELAQNLPGNMRLKGEKVLPPTVSPYVWGALYDGSQIELNGHVPGEEQRSEIAAHIKRTFPTATVIDRMSVAAGEPRNWQLAIMRSLSQLRELEDGEIAASDNNLTVRGETEHEETARAVRDALKAQVPAEFQVKEDIRFRKTAIPVVKPFVTGVELGRDRIRFAGHVPNEEARAALQAAVKAVNVKAPVVDEMQLARGADKGWLTCIRAGIQGLAKIGGGKLALTDRQLVVSGQSTDEDLIEDTVALVRTAANRACDLDPRIALIALPEPDLRWTALRREDRILISGEIPDEATKDKILARTKELFADVVIEDASTVKPALSAKWQSVALVGLDQLAKLRTGSARIESQTLSVSGEVPDTVTASAIREALKRDVPKGYIGTDHLQIRSDAMLWADQEARRKAEEDAKRKADEAAAAQRKAEAERMEGARRQLEEERQATERARSDADRAAKALQKEARIEKAPSPPQNGKKRKLEVDCREAMRATVRKGRIRFARSSAELQKDSFATLSRLAKVVNDCPKAIVDVEGHADSDGETSSNTALSERRAQAVVNYLIRAGVAADRLRAIGYGETRPIVPNTTRANKAVNRRIDFTVRIK